MRAIKTKHCSQRVPIVGTLSAITLGLIESQALNTLSVSKSQDDRAENWTIAPGGQRSCYALKMLYDLILKPPRRR